MRGGGDLQRGANAELQQFASGVDAHAGGTMTARISHMQKSALVIIREDQRSGLGFQ